MQRRTGAGRPQIERMAFGEREMSQHVVAQRLERREMAPLPVATARPEVQ